jgi:alcohol dehydrogenase (cytochrome c)
MTSDELETNMAHRRRLPRISYVFALASICAATATGSAWSAGPSQDELDAAGNAPDSWLMTNKSYDGHRYVRLDQINTRNVGELKEACAFDSGVAAPAQSAPLLYQGRFYLTAGTATIAVDAKTCKELWRHDWQLKAKPLSNPNRGAAIKDGLLVRGTPDGYLIALDMADGKPVWERQLTSPTENHYLSMPAMIVGDLVIYGTAGADFGSRGWIGAFKLNNGDEVWRYNALPEPGDPDAGSWGTPEALQHGGGSFWTPVSVDRNKSLVFVPVGNPAPDFFGDVRKGVNLYTNSVVALDLNTGKRIWARQFVPHDVRDWDLTQASPLVTTDIGGKPHDVVVVSGKDGYLRIVDRNTQDVLSELAIAKQENRDAANTVEGVHVCPGLLGGQEWSSSAYDPDRKIVIAPMVNWCGTVHKQAADPKFQVGEHFYGGKVDQDPIEQAMGVLAAVDVTSGKLRWSLETPAPLLANVTATKGGVIFTGDLKGTLYAVNADDGTVLLRHSIGASAGGGIFSYALDGKQYVAALSGPVSAFFGGSGTVKLSVLALP